MGRAESGPEIFCNWHDTKYIHNPVFCSTSSYSCSFSHTSLCLPCFLFVLIRLIDHFLPNVSVLFLIIILYHLIHYLTLLYLLIVRLSSFSSSFLLGFSSRSPLSSSFLSYVRTFLNLPTLLLPCWRKAPNVVVEWLTLLRIREVRGSNLPRDRLFWLKVFVFLLRPSKRVPD
jgi:hypothetical protein